MFEQMGTLATCETIEELYSTVLIDTPLGI